VAHCCDLSLCDDHEEALKSRVQDALCDQLDAMCALAYRMNALVCRMNALDVLLYQRSELAYRMNELGAPCDLLGVMNALAYRMNALACRKTLLDALCDRLDAMCALAYQMIELAYRMNASALNLHHVDALCARCALCALVSDALGVRCDLRQTSLRESLALDGHPFRRHALMRSDEDFPLVRLQSPWTLSQSPSGNALHEAWSDRLSEPLYELLAPHRDLNSAR
jgi:hypothetical protein